MVFRAGSEQEVVGACDARAFVASSHLIVCAGSVSALHSVLALTA